MSAVTVVLRCPDCGTRGEFPGNFAQRNVPDCCDVCRFHFKHECVHDIRCAICAAHVWLARLRAIRILLGYRGMLNVGGQ